jgi:hypothetical protein
MAFGSIPFRPISFEDKASGRCFSKGGVIVRGTPAEPSSNARSLSPVAHPATVHSHTRSFDVRSVTPNTPRYVPPHRRAPPARTTSPGSFIGSQTL